MDMAIGTAARAADGCPPPPPLRPDRPRSHPLMGWRRLLARAFVLGRAAGLDPHAWPLARPPARRARLRTPRRDLPQPAPGRPDSRGQPLLRALRRRLGRPLDGDGI